MSKIITIVGAGQMGAGIAQTLAVNGYTVRLFDSNETALHKAQTDISSRLDRLVKKEQLSKEDSAKALSNLKISSSTKDAADSSMIIEAIIEKFEIKATLFKELEQIISLDCIVASNTSSISITKMASVLKVPERFVGIHFMNPVPVMQLVEVIRGLQTSDKTYNAAIELVNNIKKTPVTAKRDYPGFIVNRILIPMLNEAVFALMEGVANPEEIDTAMKLGTNHPMGPLELADFVGLDTVLYICKILHEEFGDDKYRPAPLLTKIVEAGWYGRKTARGFYIYDEKGTRTGNSF